VLQQLVVAEDSLTEESKDPCTVDIKNSSTEDDLEVVVCCATVNSENYSDSVENNVDKQVVADQEQGLANSVGAGADDLANVEIDSKEESFADALTDLEAQDVELSSEITGDTNCNLVQSVSAVVCDVSEPTDTVKETDLVQALSVVVGEPVEPEVGLEGTNLIHSSTAAVSKPEVNVEGAESADSTYLTVNTGTTEDHSVTVSHSVCTSSVVDTMSDDLDPPSSPPIAVAKGSYNINWDEFDDAANPFQPRKRLSISPPSSPNGCQPGISSTCSVATDKARSISCISIKKH